mgnify:CR=1 FL=1
MKVRYKSWGNLQAPLHIPVYPGTSFNNFENLESENYVLYGNGRSYGDVCLNAESGLIDTKNLDRFIEYDAENSRVTCQAGMLLNDLLKFLVPRNRFVNVSPGTAYVTIGGMIANDVHGKNHHLVGSFGNHVESFQLLRSDQGVMTCSENENSDLFYATIGGLGLTGMILSASLRLKTINSTCIDTKSLETQGLVDMINLFDEPNTDYEYTVAWLDLHSKKLDGIFAYGRHSNDTKVCGKIWKPKKINVTAPAWFLNRYSNAIFNKLYHTKNRFSRCTKQHYQAFFYPLDKLEDWNLLYGKRGFYQYQFVVPCKAFEDVFFEILGLMKKYRQMSYLTVLKKFGDIKSLGMMSFPRSGYTLAMDFPNLGVRTLNMFEDFDSIILSAKGAIYPAKDARMGAGVFAESFPKLEKFMTYRDKKFNSDFWRRVTGSGES